MRYIVGFVVLVTSSLAIAQTTRPNATVTLKKLTEKREMSVEKDAFSGWENGIELELHVDGADVQGARKYGKVTIDKAVDDAGTDLTKKGSGPKGEMKDFREIQQPMSFGSRHGGSKGSGKGDSTGEEAKPSGFDFGLNLPTPSARRATAITKISGTLAVIVGGEKKIVEVKPLKANLGKTLDDPALKAVGVNVEIVNPAKPAKPKSGLSFGPDTSKGVTLILSGNLDEIASISILDASGKKLNNGSMWHDSGGTRTINYGLEKPLADSTVMQIEVWPGQKIITVPVELKDVKLP